VIIEEATPELLGMFGDSPLESFSPNAKQITFDVAIPAANLAFEYQGKQHYTDTFDFGRSDSQRQRDAAKQSLCLKHNITLIRV